MASFQLLTATKGNAFMTDIAELYAAALQDLEHEVTLAQDALPDPSFDFPIIVAPQEYRPLFLLPKLETTDWHQISQPERDVWKAAYILCVDQPGSPFFAMAERLSTVTRGVLDISPHSTGHWKSSGVDALHLPLPYRMFSGSQGPDARDRPADILFLGTDSARREEFFSNNCGYFDGIESRIHFMRHSEAFSPDAKGALFGKGRAEQLFSAKIVLNIHATKRPYFEWHRAMLAISHGCAYVTERSLQEAPLVCNRHFQSAEIEELIPHCVGLLTNPDRLEEMRLSAHKLLQQEFDHRRLWADLPQQLSLLEASSKPQYGNAANRPGKEVQSGVSLTKPLPFFRKREQDFTRFGNLVRRGGIEKGNDGLRVTESPCVLGLKTDPESPDQLVYIELVFRESTSDLSGAQVDLRYGHGVESTTISIRPDVGRRSLSFCTRLGNDLTRCSILLDLPVGSGFRMPKLRMLQPTKRQRESVQLNFSELQLQILRKRVELAMANIRSAGTNNSDKHQLASLLESTFLRQKLFLNQAFEQQAALLGKNVIEVTRNFPEDGVTPAVSVVIPLYNYASYVVSALRSVENAVFDSGVEIIVVDDASSDGGGDVVVEHMRQSPLPIALVKRTYNRGLAEARNLGVQNSRGEFVFFLDADNGLLPNGLARLWNAAREQDAPAAYGMLAYYYDPKPADPSTRNGLLSTFSWDPRWLIRGNYIDAMALFRTSILKDLGGYDSSLALQGAPGWEDYEMWLRFLSKGLEPVFVPQLIGTYRKHGASMMDTYGGHEAMVAPLLRRRYSGIFASSSTRSNA